MRRFFCAIGVACGLVVVAASWPARADVLDYLWGHSGPPTLTDVAKMIDQIHHSLVNQGTVVIKQPDVWSQARMTQFRQEYEDTMAAELTKFDVKLAGRIARSDALAAASQTAVAASISPLAKGENLQLKATDVPTERGAAVNILNNTGENLFKTGTFPDAPATKATAFGFLDSVAPVTKSGQGSTFTGIPFGLEPNIELDQRSDYITHLHRLRRINLGDDTADSAGYALYLMRVPLSVQPGDHTKKGFGAIINLTISHDFNPRFLQSTYRNLVINDLIDKLAPVTHELIRSGAAANYEYLKGQIEQAATLSRTSPGTSEEPDPLVILADKLTTIAKRTGETPFMVNRDGSRMNAIAPSDLAGVFRTRNLLVLAIETQRALGVLTAPGEGVAARAAQPLAQNLARRADAIQETREVATVKTDRAERVADTARIASEAAVDASNAARTKAAQVDLVRPPNRSFTREGIPTTPSGESPESTASRWVADALARDAREAERAATRERNAAARQAEEARQAAEAKKKADEAKEAAEKAFDEALKKFNLETEPFRNRVRLIDVRAYLRNELEAAYDLVDGHCRRESAVLQEVDYVESLVDDFYCRRLNDPGEGASNAEPLADLDPYQLFLNKLPGDLSKRGLGALAWGVALEAGLLNRQLQEDMKQTKGANDYSAPPDIDAMCFYAPEPPPEIERAFEDYVRARWPMITFALEPVTDQQNIEDAFSRSRDLQVAVAFALASGRISFKQAMAFRRIMQYEAQTISLNQTVAAFANGNDTFGWRITPRYQTPPEESNFRALTNTIIGGGPGPNYQLANSKIEPGMRELTVMVVMPSFVRGVRVDSAGDWFKLTDPEWRKLRAARAVEIGRRINEARDCLEAACKHAKYRPEDVERLRVRLRQLETMLPLQTAHVRVPYENTLGGFALFSQGKTDLVPQLVGFDGLDYIDPEKPTDLILHGRNFSLYETSVVVGGKNLAREGTRSYVLWDKDRNPYTLSSVTNPIRDENGNLVLQVLGTDNKQTTVTLPDPGSYLIQSREVMRVRVPKNVATVKRADGTDAVEVNVSTPTGVSNRILIPVRPKPPAAAPPPTVIARAAAARILDPKITVRYAAAIKPTDVATTTRGPLLGVPSGTSVRIFPKDATNLSGSADVNFVFPFPLGGTGGSTVYKAIQISGVPYKNGAYVLEEKELNDLANQIERLANAVGNHLTAGTSLAAEKVTLLIPASNPANQQILTAAEQFVIVYEYVVAQAGGPSSAAGAVAAVGPTSTPPRDDQARTASDERIVIPPPARPLNLDDLPALPEAQPWPAADRDGEPFEGITEALASPAPYDRLRRIAFQEPEGGGAAPAPPASDQPATTDKRAETVVIPPPVVPQTIVVAPQAPSVNVSVPITNNARPPRRSFFHRDREPATPQNPARRSLLQRAINGP